MNIPDDSNEGFLRYNWFINNTQDISMEWDSLVIIPESKLIINIEVKSGKGFNSLKKAASQTKSHLSIFKRIFGSVLSDGWKFVKAAFTPNWEMTEDKQPCKDCTEFILKEGDYFDIKPWIQRLINSSLKYTEDNYETEYDNLLVEIIGFSSIRQSNEMKKLIVDPHEFSKETELKISAQTTAIQGENEENRQILKKVFDTDKDSKGKKSKEKEFQSEYLCYMLTPDQLMAVKDPSPHIIIDGNYGCGKTYVLKERTKQCAEKYPDSKIAYINITSDTVMNNYNPVHFLNIMDLIAENNFKDYKNVDVVTLKDLYDHYSKHIDKLKDVDRLFGYRGHECSLVLKHFLKHSTYNHIFIDEMPPFERATEKHDFFSTDKTYCVTMKCDEHDHTVNEEWIQQMEERYKAITIILKFNMRNSENIVNLSKCFDQDGINVIPNKNITGPVCYHYQNIHKLEYSLLARATIKKYFPIPEKSEFVLLTDNVDSSITQDLFENLQEDFSDRNIVYLPFDDKDGNYEKHIKEVKEYLEKPEGILITDAQSFNGAQARNMILLTNDRTVEFDFYLRNLILRAMSFAIIINEEDLEQSFPGVVSDDNLHEFI